MKEKQLPDQTAEARKPPSLKKIYPKLGHLGKQKNSQPAYFSARPPSRLIMLAVVAIAACTTSGGTLLYTGTLQPAGGTCDPPGQATLRVNNGALLFIPRDGTLVLRGETGKAGSLEASLVLPGPDKKPYKLFFQGTADDSGTPARVIHGRYTTPRCTYTATLHKTAG